MALKTVLMVVGAMVASMGLIATFHAQIVVPAILNECRDIMIEEINRHEARPHIGAVRPEELARIFRKLDKMEEDIRLLHKELSSK